MSIPIVSQLRYMDNEQIFVFFCIFVPNYRIRIEYDNWEEIN